MILLNHPARKLTIFIYSLSVIVLTVHGGTIDKPRHLNNLVYNHDTVDHMAEYSAKRNDHAEAEQPRIWKRRAEYVNINNENKIQIDNKEANGNCPSDCICGTMTVVVCQGSHAGAELPADIPVNIHRLTLFSYASIGNKLLKFHKLRELSIYDSDVNTLPDLPDSITSLDIVNSKLKDPSSLKKLKKLHFLNLSHNNITAIDLSAVPKLLNLDLSYNPLQGMPKLPHALVSLFMTNLQFHEPDTVVEIRAPNLKHLVIRGLHTDTTPKLSTPNIQYIEITHSKITSVPSLEHLEHLKSLNISHTNISHLDQNSFKRAPELVMLDISSTNIRNLPPHLFQNNKNLRELYIHNTLLENLDNDLFSEGGHLEKLNLSDNLMLKYIEDDAFKTIQSLKQLDISRTSINMLPFSMKNLNLTSFLTNDVKLLCDCHSSWLPQFANTLGISEPIECVDDSAAITFSKLEQLTANSCTVPQIFPQSNRIARIDQDALVDVTLECNSTGTPDSMIIWHSPDDKYYTGGSTQAEPWFSTTIKDMLRKVNAAKYDARIEPLPTGQLKIHNMTRGDVGYYHCLAVNPQGLATSTSTLWKDDSGLNSRYWYSLLLGWFMALGFFLITIFVQLIRYIINWVSFECCCCKRRLSKRARQIRGVLESIETYRAQQLDRLRENYTYQVDSIKDGCYQQMDKLSEGYASQCRNIQSIKDYSTQTLTSTRAQYLDQVNRVKEYSMGQMTRVGENYVHQRQRLRKYSAQQMCRLGETYKYQQKTLNKILENMPEWSIQGCTSAAAHSVSTHSVTVEEEIEGIDVYFKVDLLEPACLNLDDASVDIYYTPPCTMRRIHNDDSIDVFEDSTSKTPSESPTKSMEWAGGENRDLPQTHKSRAGHRRSSSITDGSGKVSPLHKRALSLHYVPLPKVQEVTNPSKKETSETSVKGQEVNNPIEKEIGVTTIQIPDHQATAQL